MRLLLGLLGLSILAGIVYWHETHDTDQELQSAEGPTEPQGFTAVKAHLVETGDDGKPMYRLDAERIAQPHPGGQVEITEPRLQYQPSDPHSDDGPWQLQAHSGTMPQNAQFADLYGDVRAVGRLGHSPLPLQLRAPHLHVDMVGRQAQSEDRVEINWGARNLRGRGLVLDWSVWRLTLKEDVSGSVTR